MTESITTLASRLVDTISHINIRAVPNGTTGSFLSLYKFC